MRIHWMRVILGALLLEAVLGVTLVPLSFVNMTLFLTAEIPNSQPHHSLRDS